MKLLSIVILLIVIISAISLLFAYLSFLAKPKLNSQMLKNVTNITIQTTSTTSSTSTTTSTTTTTIVPLKIILQKEAVQNCTGNKDYNGCYFDFFKNTAIQSKNMSICLDMNMSYLGNITYQNITYSWNDINKDFCLVSYINYYKINTLNNYTICDLFVINSDKQSCLENYN